MTLSLELSPLSLSLPQSKWWTYLHPDPDAPVRLWCFPCIGAGAAIWRPWVPLLEGASEVVAVCLPGRESRLDEASFTRLDELAATIADEIAPYTDDRDVFCGSGFGALVAFEVAQRLRNAGASGPRALVACAAQPPHCRWRAPALHRLSPHDFKSAVERHYGPIPPEFSERPEFLEMLLTALRADLEALETYTPGRYAPLDIPILALAGRSDGLVAPANVAGWGIHTLARFQRGEINGGHFFISENPASASAWVRAFLATI